MRLKDKVVVVAGAATGIGRASALVFGREGARVVVGDVNDAAGEATVAAIQEAGGTALYVHCDVGIPDEVANLVETAVQTFGRLDVIYNNVGIDVTGKVHETTEETWARCLNINLSGVFRGMKYALPHMLRQGGGSIISTASIQGIDAYEGYAAYAASKGAIIALTRQVALDYAPHNIRVNCICPGTIQTPMLENQVSSPEELAAVIAETNRVIPLGRIGQPDDVAQAALYLASDESLWVTGQAFIIDGGQTIKGT